MKWIGRAFTPLGGNAPLCCRSFPARVFHFVVQRLILMEDARARILVSNGIPSSDSGIPGTTRVVRLPLRILSTMSPIIGNSLLCPLNLRLTCDKQSLSRLQCYL